MKDYMSFFEESYRRLTRDAGVRGDFIERFYQRFLAGSPDVARRFALTDMRRQQLMLARSLDEMARFSHDRRAPETLRRTAARHGPGAPPVEIVAWNVVIDDGFYYDYSHDEQAESRVIVNLKAGREWGRFGLHAWVRNLFDEDYTTRGFSFGLEPPWFERTTYTRLGAPRHYGVTLSYRY